LISFSQWFGTGIGVDSDPEMINTARAKGIGAPRVSFFVMEGEHLGFADNSFDAVLTRHAPVHVPELDRVTKGDGLFICQGVGANNMANIREAFETGSGTRYEDEYLRQIADLQTRGWSVLVTASYDVRYWVQDLPSLLFWFKAIAGANEVPADFSIQRHGPIIQDLIGRHIEHRGFATNEHRTLLIARKSLS
ncbi:MAG: class I SAM-dependent methyltransferase, partial [Thermomicrobiales bacterium]